ncbi:pseudouridine synthase [Lachnospiraceae bacterium KGMB03038]|nr:pseudouridine synthase [Lachnospiraceae bacterium KGMB03038]
MVRLNKYLSEAGVCSRREADRLIQAGRVTVDGQKAVPGMQVTEGQEVRIGKKLVAGREDKVVLAFYKPAGIVCTEDRRERKSTARFLDYPVRVTYAGRLDKDSEGLLIMTNDGDLINRMMRARYFHEKEYQVTVDRPITEEFLEGMRKGVHIKDKEKGLDAMTRPCPVEKIGKYTFRIILTQGLNRQIRRMCQVFGYQVKKLVRVRIMNIKLGSLKPGQFRPLTEEEARELYEQTETKTDAGVGRTSE